MSDDKARPRQLGRGLEALFGDDRAAVVAQAPAPAAVSGLRRVAIAKLIPNPLQPRRHFDDAALRDLAASIREKGILQPLIVRPTRHDPDSFEIVAGERRWRAAQRAQVHEAPVIVRDFTEEEALAVALIENIQRNELSPLEEAQAYARLAGDFSKTQEQVAEVVGKSRSHVANMMRLLDLPADVQDLLADGSLTAGHARAILTAADPLALAKRIVSEGLSVRAAEKLGREGKPPSAKSGRGKAAAVKRPSKDADTLALERELGNMLGLKVDVEFDGKGGRLTFEYASLEQLDDLIDRLTGRRPEAGPGRDYDPDDDIDSEDPFGEDGPPAG
ncbi:MAG: ParB/RepB/Spo0J family partition protein [Rickettsiales bacterium]